MSEMGRILLVDDDAAFRGLCARWLQELGHAVLEAGDRESALQQFRSGGVELVLLDLVMPPEYDITVGLELIASFTGVPVIVMTGHADRENGVQAIERGAWDFLGKPLEPELLRIVLNRALLKSALEREVRRLREQSLGGEELGMIGTSPAIQRLKELIRRVAGTGINVLILGPSGTGKELAARALHECSSRRKRAFVPVHCGAIPVELLENELFGHVRGGFTGADRDRDGLIDAASGGTLFLDEIGEMSPTMQVKLLRFLQDGHFRPVGGRVERSADVRVICATHRNLEEMVASGAFREDLYYRIKGVVLRTPGLTERLEDLPLLARSFLNRFAGGRRSFRLSSEAMGWLMAHSWPGHVRELRNLLHGATVLATGQGEVVTIDASDLQMAHSGWLETPQPIPSLDLVRQVAALEQKLILAALAASGNNQNQAATLLGISRVGLWKKMRRWGIVLAQTSHE